MIDNIDQITLTVDGAKINIGSSFGIETFLPTTVIIKKHFVHFVFLNEV